MYECKANATIIPAVISILVQISKLVDKTT